MTKSRQHFELMDRLGGLSMSPESHHEEQAHNYGDALLSLYRSMSKMWDDELSTDQVLNYVGDHMNHLMNGFVFHASQCELVPLFMNANKHDQKIILELMMEFDLELRSGMAADRLCEMKEQHEAWVQFLDKQTDLTRDQKAMVTPSFFKNHDEETWLKWTLISSAVVA